MKQFMLTIYQPDGPPPPPEVLEPVMRNVHALNDELRTARALVITGALHPADRGAVARQDGDASIVTDGPYMETKEHVGGFWIIAAPDRATAVKWARRAARATTLPIEVRELQAVSAGSPDEPRT
jgi:hypothetical protein